MKKKEKPVEQEIPLTMLKTPMAPNFIQLVTGGSVPIHKLSDVQLKLIGVRWVHKLLDHARAKRAVKL